MIALQRTWRFWIAEPFNWILSAFIAPQSLEQNIAAKYSYGRQRMNMYLRLLLPIALLDYLFAFVAYALAFAFRSIISPANNLYILNIFLFPALILGGGFVIGIAFSLLFSLREGLVSNLVGSFTFGLALCFTGSLLENPTGIIALAVVICLVLIFITGFVLSRETGLAISLLAGLLGTVVISFTFDLFFGLTGALTFGLAAAGAYFLGYFRLPFYLASGPSTIRTYFSSRSKQAQIFDYLHRSALYWDEYTSLPLPFLKRLLLLAYEESPERALAEIAFITVQRPKQRRAVRTVLQEITLHDLETRINLAQIASVAERLAELFPAETRLTNPDLFTPFVRLDDASRDAMRAISPIGLPGQRKALEDLQANLSKMQSRTAFRDQRLNVRLARVVDTWNRVGQSEYEQRRRSAQEAGNLNDPYKPGQFLSLKDSLFVGRRNLAQELEGALSVGSRRPTFLLNGERRMGKTSALQQLPHLLGSSYVSVFYNLQQPGLYASTATFLGVLAEGIVRAMNARAMPVESLAYDSIRSSQNDASTYNSFENWLARVEEALVREGRTLLLTFDEFEKLEEVEHAKSLDVRMLLDWMRSIIQFHQHIALLFSGVKIFSEMGTQSGIDWAGYFINVQMLRISFLKADEARHLITKPTSDYPGEEIFPSEVVDAIITETGCHPFLVQAVCSALITLLNVEQRTQATLGDVALVREKVLEGWGGHFANLWNRTSSEQRTCLEALLALQFATTERLMEQTQSDEKLVRRTLQQLLRRDLVLRDQDEVYTIAVPLFQRWLERNI